MHKLRYRRIVGIAVLGACCFGAPAAAQLTAGPNSPGAVFNDVSFGTVAWTNPGNAVASDDTYAQAAPGGGNTNYLEANNFNLAVPSSAIIVGIEVAIERRSAVADIVDGRVRIVKGGVVGATDRSNATPWPTVDTIVTYGGPTDLWGETWTAADINASSFGVALSVTDNVDVAAVDHITMKVYYTLCSAAPVGGCRVGDKSVLLLKDAPIDTMDRMVWRLINAQSTDQNEFADPTADTIYALCLYQNGALTNGANGATIPPSGVLWKPISTVGFRYRDMTGAADGIQTMVLRGSTDDRTKVIVKGKGTALADPVPPLALPVVVQLLNSDTGICWEATFDNPNIKRNEPGIFKGRFAN